MDRRITIVSVHEQEASHGGVPFGNFFQQTPQVLQQPPYKLYDTMAVPLYTSEEHREVSLRQVLQRMGAVPCNAGPLERWWQLLRRHVAVARLRGCEAIRFLRTRRRRDHITNERELSELSRREESDRLAEPDRWSLRI